MNVFLAWTISYALSAAISFPVALKQKSLLRSLIVVHVFLLLSMLLLFAFGARLEFAVSTYSVSFACVVLLASYLFLKRFGLVYALSSAVQEGCLLLSFALLVPVAGFWVAAALTALPYALLHLINSSGWWWKVTGTFLRGMLSLGLYAWLHDPLLNTALHTLGGGLLMRQGLLLSETSLRLPPRNNTPESAS
jgi:hypothetical protein